MALTQDEINTENAGSIAAANKANAAAGLVPSSAATSSTFVAPPSPTPTPAPAAAATGRYPTGYTAPASGSTPAESASDTAEDTYQADSNSQTPASIASQVEGEYSGELSAIKNYYANLTSQQTVVNTQNSGKVRATEAASGELGQDIGNSETGEQDNSNSAALATITAEEGNAEGAVYGAEAGATETDLAAARTSQLTADEQKISYLSTQAQAAQSQIQTVAGSTDLASLPQDEYDSLYEASGFSTPEQFNTYYSAARQSALTGGKTIGDATTGVWQQQIDGTWKSVIPGSNTIGDPTTGVWSKGTDGTYTNVIPAAVKTGTIGAAGSYIYNPQTGAVQTIAPAANKIVTSGGVLYSVDPTTNEATALAGTPTNGEGWSSTKAGSDAEKAAILSYAKAQGYDTDTVITNLESDPNAYYQALGAAAQAGYYTNPSVSTGTGAAPASGGTAAPTASTDQSTSDLEDAADNLQTAADDSNDASSGGSN